MNFGTFSWHFPRIIDTRVSMILAFSKSKKGNNFVNIKVRVKELSVITRTMVLKTYLKFQKNTCIGWRDINEIRNWDGTYFCDGTDKVIPIYPPNHRFWGYKKNSKSGWGNLTWQLLKKYHNLIKSHNFPK